MSTDKHFFKVLDDDKVTTYLINEGKLSAYTSFEPKSKEFMEGWVEGCRRRDINKAL